MKRFAQERAQIAVEERKKMDGLFAEQTNMKMNIALTERAIADRRLVLKALECADNAAAIERKAARRPSRFFNSVFSGEHSLSSAIRKQRELERASEKREGREEVIRLIGKLDNLRKELRRVDVDTNREWSREHPRL